MEVPQRSPRPILFIVGELCDVYANIEALLQSSWMDAVIVASPDAIHQSQVTAAAQARKHDI
jgi:predicted dehydrogenase